MSKNRIVHKVDELDQKSIKFFNQVFKDKLKESGFKLRVEHFRYFAGRHSDKLVSIREKESLIDALPRGGGTRLSLIKEGEEKELKFDSVCGKKDIFCRRKGVFVCLARALESLKFNS
jgi:hypothetical protein